MKKIIIAMFIIVIFFTPCSAQVETNDIWSANGTLWQVLGKDYSMGFYSVEALGVFVNFGSSWPDELWGFLPLFGEYIDLVFITLVDSYFPGPFNIEIAGFVSPLLGIGVVFAKVDYTHVIIYKEGNDEEGIHEEGIWILLKVEDNWTPPGLE